MKLLGIEMSFEEFDYLMCEQSKGKELKVIDCRVVAVDTVPTEEEIKQARIREIKLNLDETDYIANKLTEAIAEYLISGDIAKVVELNNKYTSELQQRQAWRDEINKLQGENDL